MFLLVKKHLNHYTRIKILVLGDNRLYDVTQDISVDTFDDLFGTWYTDNNYENRINSLLITLKRLKQWA